MEDKVHQKVELLERSYSGLVKKTIKDLARQVGFSDSMLGEVEIIVSEMVSNVIKYASEKAVFLFKPIEEEKNKGIEILCLDDGRGMANPHVMMKDGITTTKNSMGKGLGAIFRLSDYFDMYSLPGKGTVIVVRKYIVRKIKPQQFADVSLGVVAVAAPGESYCGDGWGYQSGKALHKMMAADGLGHGVNAHTASKAATDAFKDVSYLPTNLQLRNLHQLLRKTRGAVCFTCVADMSKNLLKFCGVGNIAARVVSKDQTKSCVSHNGIVGYAMPANLNESTAVWKNQDILVIQSDGVSARWVLAEYTNIEKHDPLVLAAFLYKDYGRGLDDSLVMVLKRDAKQLHPYNYMQKNEE